MPRRLALIATVVLGGAVLVGAGDLFYKQVIKDPDEYVSEAIGEWAGYIASCGETLSGLIGNPYIGDTALQMTLEASDCTAATVWPSIVAVAVARWGADSRLSPEMLACGQRVARDGQEAVTDWIVSAVSTDLSGITESQDQILRLAGCRP